MRILLQLRLRYTELVNEAVVNNFSTLASKEDITLYATRTLVSITRDRVDELGISLESFCKEAEVYTVLVAERPAIDGEGNQKRHT